MPTYLSELFYSLGHFETGAVAFLQEEKLFLSSTVPMHDLACLKLPNNQIAYFPLRPNLLMFYRSDNTAMMPSAAV